MSFATLASATNQAFFATFGETVQVLLSGVPVFTAPAIVNTDPGYQNIAGVEMVSAEPNMVVSDVDSARITALISATAQPTIRSTKGVDWQVYGEPINHRTGLTTLNLIRP